MYTKNESPFDRLKLRVHQQTCVYNLHFEKNSRIRLIVTSTSFNTAPSIADIYRDANDSISLAKGVERRSPFNNLTRGDLLENDSRHVHIYTHTVRKVEAHGDKKDGTGKKVRSCTR